MAEGGDKTEKATPKKREDARKKGQVAKSMDINGAVVLFAALFALTITGAATWTRISDATRALLLLTSTPDVVSLAGIGELMTSAFTVAALAIAPVAATCLIAGVIASVAQVGLKPATEAIKPDLKKLNPISGAKNLFGMRLVFESVKNCAKVGVVGGIAAWAVFPKLDELASVVGMPPQELLATLCVTVMSIAKQGAFAYLVIAIIDYAWQKYDTEKKLKMDHQEVKEEFKGQGLPQEIKSQQRRRQMEAAARRMMDDVPTADVVVMNPTHYAVALKYDAEQPAPVCVAKGQDLLALRIRDLAEQAGVTVVVEPPLARSLHASVEVGRMIPEETYQAVAQLLAYVYRVASAKKRAAG